LDRRAIRQALVNLIDNAIKHAPPNSIVEVGLAFDSSRPAIESAASLADGPPRSALRLWVRDSGEGIPASAPCCDARNNRPKPSGN
jgi:signal transduction histidine kinase